MHKFLLGYSQERNPFECDLSMRNISTGITADCTGKQHPRVHIQGKESSNNSEAEELN